MISSGSSFPNYYDSTLSADGRWLANVNYDGGSGSPRLRVYDLTTGAIAMEDDVLPKSYGPLGSPRSAEFSPDGQWLVYLDLGGDLRLWRVGHADGPQSVPVPDLVNVSSVSVGPGMTGKGTPATTAAQRAGIDAHRARPRPPRRRRRVRPGRRRRPWA